MFFSQSKSYIGPYIHVHVDASYKISLYLGKRFQRRYLEIDQLETWIAYGGHVYKHIWTKWAMFIEEMP